MDYMFGLSKGPFIDFQNVIMMLRIIDWITVVYFCFEYIVRFVCAPDKKKFFFQVSCSNNISY